jgi:hypothetical protein
MLNLKVGFLTWNPKDYDNITVSRIKFDDIWTPGKPFFSYFIFFIVYQVFLNKKWFFTTKKDTFL